MDMRFIATSVKWKRKRLEIQEMDTDLRGTTLLLTWVFTPFFMQGVLQGFSKQETSPTLLATWFILVYYLAYYSATKTVATYSSETSTDFQRTTRRYILKDRTLLNNLCENCKSYLSFFQAPKKEVPLQNSEQPMFTVATGCTKCFVNEKNFCCPPNYIYMFFQYQSRNIKISAHNNSF